MQQVVSFDVDHTYFQVTVTLTNTSDDTFYDVRYMRNVDPDQAPEFTTKNFIFEQGPEGVLVAAYVPGESGGTSPFFYYSTDPRAVVANYGFSNFDPYAPEVTTAIQPEGYSTTADNGIAIAFGLGTLSAGASATLTFFVGLAEDLQEVIESIVPEIIENGPIYGTEGDDTGETALVGTPGDNQIFGLGGDDQLFGLGGNDMLDGGDGNDYLDGSEGDDTLIGGAGSDWMAGGAGGDTLDGARSENDPFDLDVADYAIEEGPGGVTVDLFTGITGIATDTYGDQDTLIDIEGVRGSMLGDALVGTPGENEYFWGLAGDDNIDGGADYDEVRYEQDANFLGNSGVIVNLSGGTAWDTGIDPAETLIDIEADPSYEAVGELIGPHSARDGFGNTDTLTSIEGVWGTNSDDVLIGNSQNNSFTPLAGNDIIYGRAVDDSISSTTTSIRAASTARSGRPYQSVETNYSDEFITIHIEANTAYDPYGDIDQVFGIEAVRGNDFDDMMMGNGADKYFAGFAGWDFFDGQERIRHRRL